MAEFNGKFDPGGNALFDQVGKLAQVQNALNQNKLFQGQVAAGRALQQAIDPQTGLVDYPKANALITANPAAAPYALEAVNKLLTGQGQSIANTTGQTKLQGVYTDNLRQDFLAAQKGGIDPHLALVQGIAMGRYPAAMAAIFAGGGDVGGLNKDALARESAIALGPDAVRAAYGAPETQDTGGQQVTSLVNPATGTKEVMGGNGAVLAKTLTPAELAQRQTIISGGKPVSVPQSALVTAAGQPKASSLTGPNGEAQAQYTPSEQAAAQATGQGYGGMALQLTQRASKVADNKALLGNMEGLLEQFTPGPQSGFWKALNQLATESHLAPPGSPPANKAAAQEEFGKLAFQLAQSQFQALGGTGTDSKLDSTMHTSPSDLLTRYGNKGIIGLLKGNEDAIQAQNEAWQKWQAAGNGPETYGQFITQWQRIYDPRVFQAQYASPQERKAMLDGMTAPERARFKADYTRAHKLGWVQ